MPLNQIACAGSVAKPRQVRKHPQEQVICRPELIPSCSVEPRDYWHQKSKAAAMERTPLCPDGLLDDYA
ncbi:MAG: hypothetical protein JWM54_1212 [Acidobacteriaceae bacterium]|nr:hypothetical protein [Acidobacteriaceae bacterium]